MPKNLDEEPVLINLVPIESKFAIIDQEKVIQNVDINQGNITCETCDKFIKMDVPWKKSSNQIIYIPVEDKKKAAKNLVWVIQRVKN